MKGHSWASCSISRIEELIESLWLCPGCNYHEKIGSTECFSILFDNNEFEELDKTSKALIYKTLTEGTVGEYLLGTKRTLAEYGTFAGLDFINGEVLENC